MASFFVLKNGLVISELDPRISISKSHGLVHFCYDNLQLGSYTMDEIAVIVQDASRKDLPCSTYSPPFSSPANSQPADTSPTQNTPIPPPPVSDFKQELHALLSETATLIHKLSAVLSKL